MQTKTIRTVLGVAALFTSFALPADASMTRAGEQAKHLAAPNHSLQIELPFSGDADSFFLLFDRAQHGAITVWA